MIDYGAIVGMLAGGAIFWWGWSVGYRYRPRPYIRRTTQGERSIEAHNEYKGFIGECRCGKAIFTGDVCVSCVAKYGHDNWLHTWLRPVGYFGDPRIK